MNISNRCHPERPSVGREGPAKTASITTPVASNVEGVLRVVLATLREIFDENAYTRFLSRRALAPSRASYLAFLEENSATRERRPRCC
jgi:hypothetical protein